MSYLSVRRSLTSKSGGTWFNLRAMTKVEITIQNGRVTWVEQSGDELPQELWNDFNVAIRSAVERYLK